MHIPTHPMGAVATAASALLRCAALHCAVLAAQAGPRQYSVGGQAATHVLHCVNCFQPSQSLCCRPPKLLAGAFRAQQGCAAGAGPCSRCPGAPGPALVVQATSMPRLLHLMKHVGSSRPFALADLCPQPCTATWQALASQARSWDPLEQGARPRRKQIAPGPCCPIPLP